MAMTIVDLIRGNLPENMGVEPVEDGKDQPVPTSCHSKIPENIWMTKDAHGADERSILRAAAAVTTYPLATVAGFHGLALRLVQRFQ